MAAREQEHASGRAIPSLGWERGELLGPLWAALKCLSLVQHCAALESAPQAPWLFMVRNVFTTC